MYNHSHCSEIRNSNILPQIKLAKTYRNLLEKGTGHATHLEDVPEITDGKVVPEGVDETPNVVEEHAGNTNPEGDVHVSWTI